MAKIKVNKIERTKRKTIALLVNADASLTVRAPFFVTNSQIDTLINKKLSWVKRKIGEVNKRPKVTTKEYVNGEGFLLLGKSYRLKIGNYQSIELGDFLYFPRTEVNDIQQELLDWYKQQAIKKFTLRAIWYSKKMGVEYSAIRLSEASKRWGSCGRNNTLSINWRLIMAPLSIIDYVVVHELSHVVEKNHSKKFWNRVRTILPNYEKSRLWLKDNGQTLNI